MAKKQILVSDISGEAIDGAHAQIKIHLSSKPKSTFAIDAAEAEIAELLASAREMKRRGRPKAAA